MKSVEMVNFFMSEELQSSHRCCLGESGSIVLNVVSITAWAAVCVVYSSKERLVELLKCWWQFLVLEVTSKKIECIRKNRVQTTKIAL